MSDEAMSSSDDEAVRQFLLGLVNAEMTNSAGVDQVAGARIFVDAGTGATRIRSGERSWRIDVTTEHEHDAMATKRRASMFTTVAAFGAVCYFGGTAAGQSMRYAWALIVVMLVLGVAVLAQAELSRRA